MRGRGRGPLILGHLATFDRWPLELQVQLVQSLVLLLLLLDVCADDSFVSSYCRNEVSACPEMLPHKILFAYFGGIAISMCT